MKIKAKILIPIVILFVVSIMALVYFTSFSNLVIVQDQSWPLVLPKGTYLRLRINLIKERYRLSVVNVEQQTIWEPGYLEDSLLKQDRPSVLFLTPVVSAAVNEYNIDLKEEMQNAEVIGIGKDKGYFDYTLKSNDLTAWANAAKIAVGQDDVAAIIYNGDTVSQATVIFNNLDPEKAFRYNSLEYGNLMRLEIPKLFEQDKVTIVLTPGFEGMTDLFENNTVKWVTDYRYSHVVPYSFLAGVVAPDIFSSIKDIISNKVTFEPEQGGDLQYEFRAVR